MTKRRERRTLGQKIRNAHEWLFECDELAEKVEEESKLPSFDPRRWEEVAHHIRLARMALGRAQSHARRLGREGLTRKGLR